MLTAAVICWCIALALATVHVLEHGSDRSAHAIAWRALPRRLRFALMAWFFSAALAAIGAWFLFPAVTVAMLAAADLTGVIHLFRHWRPVS